MVRRCWRRRKVWATVWVRSWATIEESRITWWLWYELGRRREDAQSVVGVARRVSWVLLWWYESIYDLLFQLIIVAFDENRLLVFARLLMPPSRWVEALL